MNAGKSNFYWKIVKIRIYLRIHIENGGMWTALKPLLDIYDRKKEKRRPKIFIRLNPSPENTFAALQKMGEAVYPHLKAGMNFPLPPVMVTARRKKRDFIAAFFYRLRLVAAIRTLF